MCVWAVSADQSAVTTTTAHLLEYLFQLLDEASDLLSAHGVMRWAD